MELTPLIDVVFLLLIFLIVTTSFSQAQEGESATSEIPVDLPEATTGSAGGESQRVVLSVQKDGTVDIRGTDSVGGGDLGGRLRALHDERPEARILIRGDEEAMHGRMIEVLDEARRAGFSAVQLAARQPGGE